jgi:hypothetical protein
LLFAQEQTSNSPTTNFLRSFFTGARAASPNTIMAAKAKAQDIIDNNAVGMWQHTDA